MLAEEWRKRLKGLPVQLRYFETIGSTNDEALNWAASGADEYSLVIADHQSAGRGRMQRTWVTQPNSALAFSLILHPNRQETGKITLFSPLAALALCESLAIQGIAQELCQIKWPNDVLINGKKVAGILVESIWMGEDIQSVVIGMGVNVQRQSVPEANRMLFPAASLETELNRTFDRITVLHGIIEQIIQLRQFLTGEQFIEKYEALLAYKGEKVRIQKNELTAINGIIAGVYPDGDLKLQQPDGSLTVIHVGDVHLRPA